MNDSDSVEGDGQTLSSKKHESHDMGRKRLPSSSESSRTFFQTPPPSSLSASTSFTFTTSTTHVKRTKTVAVTIKPTVAVTIKPTLQTLPLEILQKITQYLSQQDTFTLLTLSSAFTKPCLRRLYKKVRLSEKYQDTYHYKLSKTENSSLISSFPIILKFFRSVYEDCLTNGGKPMDSLKYVEELHCFNYLDSGELDIHRYLTKEDFKNQLRLRQYWDIFIRQLCSLRVWNLPKLPIEKISYLKDEVKAQIRFLGFSLNGLNSEEGENNEEEYDDFDYLPLEGFDNLNQITINFDNLNIFPSSSLHYLSTLLQGSANNVEKLEINGNFGKLDRNIEHYLRHFDFSQDVNLKSSFMKGFEVGKLVYKHGFGVNEIQRSFNELGDQILTNEQEDGNERNRRLIVVGSGDEQNPRSENNREDSDNDDEDEPRRNQRQELDETQPDQYLSPITSNLKFAKTCHFQQFTSKFCNQGSTLWELLDTLRIMNPMLKFDKLRSLSLNNFLFEGTERDNLKWEQLSQIVNFQQIEEFKMINVYQSDKDVEKRIRFSDSLTNLKSLTLIHFEHISQGVDLHSSITTPVFPATVDISTEFPTLCSLLNSNHKLEKLALFGFGKIFTLRSFIPFLSQFPCSQTLKEIQLILPQDTLTMMRRLVNIHSFKMLSRFGDLTQVDDLSYSCYKSLIEIFNRLLRIEDYHCASGNYDVWIDTGFEREMRFLYEEDVNMVWKCCPTLERFVYFGLSFNRP